MGFKDIQHLPERHKAALANTLLCLDVLRHAIEQEVVHYRDVSHTMCLRRASGTECHEHHHPICPPDRGLLGAEHDPEGVEASLCKVAEVIKCLPRHREARAQAAARCVRRCAVGGSCLRRMLGFDWRSGTSRCNRNFGFEGFCNCFLSITPKCN